MAPLRTERRSASSRLVAHPTLCDALGPGVAYVRRPSPSANRWLYREPGALDFLSGAQLVIAGGMPVVCSAAVATPAILDLLEDAGVPVEAELHLYRGLDDHLAALRRLVGGGWRFFATPHEATEIDPRACVSDPDVARTLNDKGRLAEFVPAHLVPRRHVVPPSDLLPARTLLRDGPVVLKAANRLPSGGGLSVRICRTETEVERAREEMAHEPGVVVEELLPIVHGVCVNGLVHVDGRVEGLGVAEQVCDDAGHYLGNWIDGASDARLSAAVLRDVHGVFECAAAMGYRGFAGIDVATLPDGSARVHDLNFRMNGSTAALCLRDSVQRDRGAATLRFRTWRGRSDFDALLSTVRRALGRGAFLPLSLYDPSSGPDGGAARVGGLVLGTTRDAVRSEEERLAADGLL